MKPIYFKNQFEFREWLETNHDKETELVVEFYRVSTKKPTMTWSESVDQAICFGWIDSIRRTIDEESYSIRFSPRKSSSNWSAINIKKVEELTKAGLMHPAGLAAFEKRKEYKSGIYSFENQYQSLPKKYEKIFIKNESAWEYYSNQSPSYKKGCTHWILSAKQEKTKLSRLEKLIVSSEQKIKIYP